MSDRHPVVGTWRVSVEIPGAPAGMINLATFSLDGGVIVAFPSPTPAAPGAGHQVEFWTPALGRWESTGDLSAAMFFTSLGVNEHGASVGTHGITAALQAGADGQGLTGPFTITITGADGSTLGSVSGTITATRIGAHG
ncbi:MAG: hypothetical protein M3Z20_04645 [Chloroflexota bacterium]|nr:hypothetical protein [Chloroflexota bacterium]